mgnify:FL=1
MKKRYELIFLAIGLVAVAAMVWSIGLNEIVANIKQTSWWFVAIVAVRLLVYPLNTVAWKAVIPQDNGSDAKISFAKLLKLTISGYAINYITPVMALGGEPYRILRLKEYVGLKKATSSVLMYAIMHVLSHFVFWILGFVLILLYPKTNSSIKIISACFILLCILASFFIAKFFKSGIAFSFFNTLKKIPIVGKWARKKMTTEYCDGLQQIDFQIQDLYFNHKNRFFRSLVTETASRIAGCLEILLIMQAIGMEVNLLEAIIVSTGTSLFANILFFSPMQLGTKEGGLILALKSLGMEAANGVYIGLAMRISELFWIIVGVVMIKTYKLKTKIK